MIFREDTLNTSFLVDVPSKYRVLESVKTNETTQLTSKSNGILDFLFGQNSKNAEQQSEINAKREGNNEAFILDEWISEKTVNFIVPLAGRWEIFERFMRNYEENCLQTNEKVTLVIVLFESVDEIKKQSELIKNLFSNLIRKYKLIDSKRLTLLVNNGKEEMHFYMFYMFYMLIYCEEQIISLKI